MSDDLNLLQPLLRALGVDLTPASCTECSIFDLTSTARPGDHVAVRSVVLEIPDVIWHHGIYLGNSYLAHMHPVGNISRVTMDRFMARVIDRQRQHANTTGVTTCADRAVIVKYHGDSDYQRARTRTIAAWSCTDESMQAIVYHGLRANCECFAVWCRTERYEKSILNVVRTILDRVPITPISLVHPKFGTPL